MASTPIPLPPKAARAPMGSGHIGALIGGCIGALIALVFFVAGGAMVWAHASQRDAGGFYNSGVGHFDTQAAAITAENVDLGNLGGATSGWVSQHADATIRLRAARVDGGAVFVGIARQADLDAYLAGVAHQEVSTFGRTGMMGDRTMGNWSMNGQSTGSTFPSTTMASRSAMPPARSNIWAAQATGAGTRTLTWKPAAGRWGAIVMNASGAPVVMADIEIGAHTNLLLPIGLGVLAIGLLLSGGSAWLLGSALRPRAGPYASDRQPASAWTTEMSASAGGAAKTGAGSGPIADTHQDRPTAADEDADERPYPVQVEADLKEPLSRGLWLVKWLLVLPHVAVLAFLWAGFVVATLAAFVAILVTGRYPRALFDFNAGVMRWNWRVQFYAGSGLGTDRYPPFTLGHVPGYPARLQIAYPERLSRRKVLVKSWLLAIPHYLILGSLVSGWGGSASNGYASFQGPSVMLVLLAVAMVTLVFTGRYPQEVFRLVVGINRWFYRVLAYAALMRDEYPPFRLGR